MSAVDAIACRAGAGIMLLAMAALSPAIAADTGRICISSVPAATAGEKSLANATASATPYEFTIRIGSRAAVATAQDKSVEVSGIDAGSRQMIAIRRNGVAFASFRARLADYEHNAACLWFGPLYETWSLSPLKGNADKCSCPDGA